MMPVSRFALQAVLAAGLTVALALPCLAQSPPNAADVAIKARQLIDAGDFRAGEALLHPIAGDGPAITEPARLLEILRRIRYDFALSPEAMLDQLRRTIPDATAD